LKALTLPYPPSLNSIWRTWKGRILLSAEGRAYRERSALTARAAGLKPTEKHVAMWLHFYRPRRTGDLDNALKALLDSIRGIAYLDDSQVVELHAYRFDDKDNPRVEVEIREAPEGRP